MRPKSGLHKKISSIFDGISIPGRGATDSSASSNAAPGGLTASNASGSTSPAHGSDLGLNPSAGGFWKKVSASNGGSGIQRGKIVLVVVLALVLIAVVGMVLVPPSQIKAEPKMIREEKPGTPGKKTPETITWTLPEPLPTALRDPMKIVAVERTELVPEETTKQILFVIRGVVLGERGNTAIVGSEIVSVGDTVQGARVIRIDRNEVEFEQDGQRWIQTVSP
jgi:hypothetical protein